MFFIVILNEVKDLYLVEKTRFFATLRKTSNGRRRLLQEAL
jgi:hypothetical protein